MDVIAISGSAEVHRGEHPEDTTDPEPEDSVQIYKVETTNLIKSHDLVTLLSGTLHTGATVAHDKIYGLFGLLKPEILEGLNNANPPIIVNYDQPVEELYRDVARFLISHDSHLFLLQMHGTKRKLTDLPSWVPDWSVPKNFASTLISLEDVEGLGDKAAHATIRPSDNPNKLILGAKTLGDIEKVGMPFEQPPNKEDTMRSIEMVLKNWVAMLAIGPAIKPRVPEETRAESIWRAIIANKDASMDEPPKEYASYFAALVSQMDLQSEIWDPPKQDNQKVNQRDIERFVGDVVWTCTDRRLCKMAYGSLCLAPANSMEGDELVFFVGGHTPFVIREYEHEDKLIGPCYIHGFSLDGTAELEKEDIVLR